MSANNYIVIRKEGRKYKGYEQCEGCKEKFDTPSFVTTSLVAAIKKAQNKYTEFGYRIDGL